METIGVGLIGSGFMGKSHAIAWAGVRTVFGDVPAPRLEHLADATDALGAGNAAAFGFARGGGDWRALIADPAVDVVSITAPNPFHADMAIAALEAGKHVWCEKPMAPTLADAMRMRDAARVSGKVAILGYNYIQNPMIRHMRTLLDDGVIGPVNHFRMEMDEDFMADPKALHSWRSEAQAGYGALDDFAVHPLALIRVLFGGVAEVMAEQIKPYADRPDGRGGRRPVDTHDIAAALLRLETGVAGTIQVSRTAWGRKGRIAVQIFGAAGTIVYDQERMNEVQLYVNDGDRRNRGFRTVLSAPCHPPYDRFVPAPGHGLGFNDLKIIECRELLERIAGRPSHSITFDDGLELERSVHAMARSDADGRWTAVAAIGR